MSFRRKALRLRSSFRLLKRLSRFEWGASPLPLALSLAIAFNGAVVWLLLAHSTTSPDQRPLPSDADTPRLLELARGLKAAGLDQPPPVLPSHQSLDPLPLPPPPPPLDALPAERAVGISDGWQPREAADVLAGAIAWLPPEREGFRPADPFQQAIRRRQRWLLARQVDQLKTLWDGAAERRSAGGLEWRSLPGIAVQQLDLREPSLAQLHGASLVHGQQLTLLWREQGRWWLIRSAATG